MTIDFDNINSEKILFYEFLYCLAVFFIFYYVIYYVIDHWIFVSATAIIKIKKYININLKEVMIIILHLQKENCILYVKKIMK